MTSKEDLKEGLTILRKESFKRGLYFNLVGNKWIYPLSIILSRSNNCKRFWANVCRQNRIIRIFDCYYLRDIFHGIGIYLFEFALTEQGWPYWDSVCHSLFDEYGEDTPLDELIEML